MSVINQNRPPYDSEIHYCDETFRALLKLIASQADYYVNLQMLQNAYDIAKEKHADGRRHSGLLYLRHPLAVFETLVHLKCKTTILAAALLHDTMEDCGYTYEEIRKTFNAEVADIVDAVTAIKRVEKEAEARFDQLSALEKHKYLDDLTDQKLVNAQFQRESFLVRFADREHNLKTIDACTSDKRRKKIEQTQTFLIPAARRFGMRYFITTLSDYCLKFSEYYPEADSAIPPIHRRRNELLSVSSEAFFQFDEIMQEAISSQDFFAFPSYNPLARLVGSKVVGSDVIVEPRRRLRPFEIAEQLDSNLPLDQARDLYFERQDVCLTEVLLVCKSNSSPDILPHFISFHRSFLAPRGITFEVKTAGQDCITIVLTDELENNYHLVLVPAEKIASYFIGIETARIPTGPISDILKPQISVFAYSTYKRLRKIQVPVGSTALDLAFALHPMLGLSVISARIKKYTPGQSISFTGEETTFGLGTILNENDVVFFDADYEEEIGCTRKHANLSWFSHITTEHARTELIKYLQYKYPATEDDGLDDYLVRNPKAFSSLK